MNRPVGSITPTFVLVIEVAAFVGVWPESANEPAVVSFNYLFGSGAHFCIAGGVPDNLLIVLSVAFCNDATIDFRM
jgi:hypothetical protein